MHIDFLNFLMSVGKKGNTFVLQPWANALPTLPVPIIVVIILFPELNYYRRVLQVPAEPLFVF